MPEIRNLMCDRDLFDFCVLMGVILSISLRIFYRIRGYLGTNYAANLGKVLHSLTKIKQIGIEIMLLIVERKTASEAT